MYVRGFETGYCYLELFRAISLPVPALRYFSDVLGRFPMLRDVVSIILRYIADPFTRFPRPLCIDGLYHIYPYEQLSVSFDELFYMSLYRDAMVGGLADDPVYDMPHVIRQLVSNSGLNVDDVVKKYVTESLASKNSPFRDALIDSAVRDAGDRLRFTVDRVTVPYRLLTSEVALLENAYPELKIGVSSAPMSHPHAVAAAARVCDAQVALLRMGYNSTSVPSADKHVCIKDVGGNPVTHLNRGRRNVHCCAPVLDARDAQRHSDRVVELRGLRLGDARRAYLRGLVDRDAFPRFMCSNRAQDCVVRADACVFIHSTYDMSLLDICDSMVAASADRACIAVCFDPLMLVDRRGNLKGMNFDWVRYCEEGVEKVKFNFFADSSWAYVHNWDTYIQQFVNSFALASSGEAFFFEQSETRLGTVFIKVTRNLVNHIPPSVLTFRHYTLLNNFVRVSFYDFDFNRKTLMDFRLRASLVRRRFLIPRKLYARVLSYGMSMNQSKFTYATLLQYVESCCSRITVNGVDVVDGYEVDVEVKVLFAAAMYCHLYVRRYDVTQLTNKILDEERALRDDRSRGILRRIAYNIKSIVMSLFTGGLDDLIADSEKLESVDLYSSPRLKMLLWTQMPNLFSVRVDKAVEFFDFSTNVEEYVTREVAPTERMRRAAIRACANVAPIYNSAGDFHRIICDMVEGRATKSVSPVLGTSVPRGTLPAPDVENVGMVESVPVENVDIGPDGAARDTLSGEITIPGRDPVPVSQTLTNCSAQLKLRSAPRSDGNCFYSSFLAAADITISCEAMRHQLLNSRFLTYFPRSMRDELDLEVPGRSWAGDATVRLTAVHFGYDVCIHVDGADPMHLLYSCGLKGAPLVHLRFNGVDHYEYFVPALVGGAKLADISTERGFFTTADRSALLSARARIDCLANLRSGLLFNRSAVKLADILTKYPAPRGRVLDLSAAPGGAVQHLMRLGYDVVANVYEGGLRMADLRFPFVRLGQTLTFISPLAGDLNDVQVREYLASLAHMSLFSFVYADGAVCVDGCEDRQAEENFPLIWNECIVVMSCLAIGGMAVIKILDCHTAGYYSLLHALLTSFTEVVPIKPVGSRAASSEKYIICRDFRGCGMVEFEEYRMLALIQRLKRFQELQVVALRAYAVAVQNPFVDLRVPANECDRMVDHCFMDVRNPIFFVDGSFVGRTVAAADGGPVICALPPVHGQFERLNYTAAYFQRLSESVGALDVDSEAVDCPASAVDVSGVPPPGVVVGPVPGDSTPSPVVDRGSLVSSCRSSESIPDSCVSCVDSGVGCTVVDGSTDSLSSSGVVDVLSTSDAVSRSCADSQSVVPDICDQGDVVELSSDSLPIVPATFTESICAFVGGVADAAQSGDGRAIATAVTAVTLLPTVSDMRTIYGSSLIKTYYSDRAKYRGFSIGKFILPFSKKKVPAPSICSVKLPTSSVDTVFVEGRPGAECSFVVPVGEDGSCWSSLATSFLLTVRDSTTPRRFKVGTIVFSRHVLYVTVSKHGKSFPLESQLMTALHILCGSLIRTDHPYDLAFDFSHWSCPSLTYARFVQWVHTAMAGVPNVVYTFGLTRDLPVDVEVDRPAIDLPVSRAGENSNDVAKKREAEDNSNNSSSTIPSIPGEQFVAQYAASRACGAASSRFSPKRVSCITKVDHFLNAVAEIREFWRYNQYCIRRECESLYRNVLPTTSNYALKKMVESSDCGLGIIDTTTRTLRYKPVSGVEGHRFAFDGTSFVSVSQLLRGEVTAPSRYAIVSDRTCLLNDIELYRATSTLELDFTACQLILKQGVPGCGKTHTILQMVNLDFTDLVLTATREAAEDFRTRLNERNARILDRQQLKRICRTLDSYLIHEDIQMYSRLIVDEALMAHFGHIACCIAKSRAKTIVLIGDKLQIPYINRNKICDMRFSLFPDVVLSSIEQMNITYRCTLTTTALLSPLYVKQGYRSMQSTSHVWNEFELRKYVNITSINAAQGTKFLVFKQSEKTLLAKAGCDVSTVHEYQGKQTDDIIIVRTSELKHSIYESQPHMLVAVSRHRRSIVYYTPDLNDALSRWFKGVIDKPRDFYFRFQLKVDLRGGARFDFRSRDPIFRGDGVYDQTERLGFSRVPCDTVRVLSDYYMPLPDTVPAASGFCDVTVLQRYYDELFPLASTYDYSGDIRSVNVEEPLSFALANAVLDSSRARNYRERKFDRMHPVLRTHMPHVRPNTSVETLLSMVKRNLNVPDIKGDIDSEVVVEYMLERFMDVYVLDAHRHEMRSFQERQIYPNAVDISEWLIGQGESTVDRLETDVPLHLRKLWEYSFMIKPTVKPKLTDTAHAEYAALQTIAFTTKDINAIFCPVFKEVYKRLCVVMPEKFKIFSELTNEQFCEHFDRVVPAYRRNVMTSLEVDVSKYDKSQGAETLDFECALMAEFGVPEYLVNLWRYAHIDTILRDRINGISLRVRFQRKSGDASTFYGNTFFLMSVLASLFPIESCDFAAFAGDDSILFGDDFEDMNDYAASIFNLETKFFLDFHFSYFCSKFLLYNERKSWLIPDPVKLITKLGRADLVNEHHREDYRVSLVDLTTPFGDFRMFDMLSFAVAERYKRQCTSRDSVFYTLYNLPRDVAIFNSLYDKYDTDVYCYDPSRPSLDV